MRRVSRRVPLPMPNSIVGLDGHGLKSKRRKRKRQKNECISKNVSRKLPITYQIIELFEMKPILSFPAMQQTAIAVIVSGYERKENGIVRIIYTNKYKLIPLSASSHRDCGTNFVVGVDSCVSAKHANVLRTFDGHMLRRHTSECKSTMRQYNLLKIVSHNHRHSCECVRNETIWSTGWRSG